jgi:hypothetical protein
MINHLLSFVPRGLFVGEFNSVDKLTVSFMILALVHEPKTLAFLCPRQPSTRSGLFRVLWSLGRYLACGNAARHLRRIARREGLFELPVQFFVQFSSLGRCSRFSFLRHAPPRWTVLEPAMIGLRSVKSNPEFSGAGGRLDFAVRTRKKTCRASRMCDLANRKPVRMARAINSSRTMTIRCLFRLNAPQRPETAARSLGVRHEEQ